MTQQADRVTDPDIQARINQKLQRDPIAKVWKKVIYATWDGIYSDEGGISYISATTMSWSVAAILASLVVHFKRVAMLGILTPSDKREFIDRLHDFVGMVKEIFENSPNATPSNKNES